MGEGKSWTNKKNSLWKPGVLPSERQLSGELASERSLSGGGLMETWSSCHRVTEADIEYQGLYAQTILKYLST